MGQKDRRRGDAMNDELKPDANLSGPTIGIFHSDLLKSWVDRKSNYWLEDKLKRELYYGTQDQLDENDEINKIDLSK